jgi:hypothetical protein
LEETHNISFLQENQNFSGCIKKHNIKHSCDHIKEITPDAAEIAWSVAFLNSSSNGLRVNSWNNPNSSQLFRNLVGVGVWSPMRKNEQTKKKPSKLTNKTRICITLKKSKTPGRKPFQGKITEWKYEKVNTMPHTEYI